MTRHIKVIGDWLNPKAFRWEWALFFEYADPATGEWEPVIHTFTSRRGAREFRAAMGDATCFRNWSLKRRLIQRNWEHVRNLRGWTG